MGGRGRLYHPPLDLSLEALLIAIFVCIAVTELNWKYKKKTFIVRNACEQFQRFANKSDPNKVNLSVNICVRMYYTR